MCSFEISHGIQRLTNQHMKRETITLHKLSLHHYRHYL